MSLPSNTIESSSIDGNIGVLVVHGIGSQQRGETLHNCLHDLINAYENVEILDADGVSIDLEMIRNCQLDRVILRQGCWQVRFYEVYWASILDGCAVEGTYNKLLFEETTWFPWLNWRSGQLPVSQYSEVLVLLRTIQLWILGLSATFLDELVGKSVQNKYLDQIVADVTNYAHSMVGDIPPSSLIAEASEEILTRFRGAAALAIDEGCTELQVIAHSLGTVIAFNAMSRYRTMGDQELESLGGSKNPLPITRFYTIGSPLEKFRFVWTSVILPCKHNFQIWHENRLLAEANNLNWFNYYSPFDFISGKLVHFEGYGNLSNRLVWGLGGLVNSHVSYFINAIVLNDITKNIRGPSIKISRTLNQRFRFVSVSIAQSLVLPVVLTLALLASVALILIFSICLAGLTGLGMVACLWAYNFIFALMGFRIPLQTFLVGWIEFWSITFLPMIVVLFTTDGYGRSLSRHLQYWRS